MTGALSGRRGRCALVALMGLGVLWLPAGVAGADSFAPIRVQVSTAPVARLHGPLAINVAVSADAGVLDIRTASVRVRVKLAVECGGEFANTAGTVLLDRRLNPQPDPGEAYQASVSGSGRPAAYGVQTVCVFLEEEGDNRQFASDTDSQVNVSQQCTALADRFDKAASARARSQVELRHAHGAAARRRLRRLVARLRATAGADKRRASLACGPGVPL